MPGRRPNSSTRDCNDTVYTGSDLLGAGESLLQPFLGREPGTGQFRLCSQDDGVEKVVVGFVGFARRSWIGRAARPAGGGRRRRKALPLVVDHQSEGHGNTEVTAEGHLDVGTDLLAVGPVRLVG